MVIKNRYIVHGNRFVSQWFGATAIMIMNALRIAIKLINISQ